MTAEFEVEHKGQVYWVEVEFDCHHIDDSFEGHMAGYQYTYHSSHREVDIDTLDITSCTGGDGDEVDTEEVPGLRRAIEDKALELEV